MYDTVTSDTYLFHNQRTMTRIMYGHPQNCGGTIRAVEAAVEAHATLKCEESERLLAQIERILRSNTFHKSDVLKRLLKFLSERTASGEADGLKEYVIATDALGKPSSYDPRFDSSVRIQIGRLRQKLAEYYQKEGSDDSTVIELRKGRFKLTWTQRTRQQASRVKSSYFGAIWRTVLGTSAILIVLALAAHTLVKANLPTATTRGGFDSKSPDIGKLWDRFLTGDRPLILAIQDPTFLELNRKAHLYRRIVAPDEVTQDDFAHNDVVFYTPIGESQVAFRLGRVLGPQIPNTTVIRASELSWKQLSDNNVVFAGRGVFFQTLLNRLSSHLQLVIGPNGIENVHPLPGEPKIFLDRLSGPPAADGEMYALVSRVPGPTGSTVVESFISSHSPGYIGAVESFTDSTLAHALVDALRKPSGEMPTYYQVVLKVRFKTYFAVETSFVTYRELK
jgi:hypothetical protein